MSEEPHALIAGAGIGGLAAALCVAAAGFRVSLFEKSAVVQEVGAGLQIGPNASAILRKLGVLPRLAGLALAPEAIRIRRASDGATLQSLSLKDAEQRWGAPYLLIHRGDLHRALYETAQQAPTIAMALDSTLKAFSQSERSVDVTIQQGTSDVYAQGDCLIGADGVRSLVRQQLAGRSVSLPKTVDFISWRALVAAKDVAPALRSPESTLWLGPGQHLVHYPLRGGSVINVVAVIAQPTAVDWQGEIWSQEGDAEEIRARFAGWHKDAQALVGAAANWRKWPLGDLPPLPQWAFGRIALLGDAAHPMLPFLAQGAAQAIEDAAMLGAMLKPDAPIAPCLAAYAATRRPRANRVQAASRRQAAIYHLGPPANLLRDLALRGLGAERFLSRYDWLYRVRPEVR